MPDKRQLAVQCDRCTQATGTPPYVDLSTCPSFVPTKSSHPSHCPRCSKLKLFRSYDYADVLVQEYFGLTRQSALQALSLFNSLRATTPTRSIHSYTTLYTTGSVSQGSKIMAGTTVVVNELAGTPKEVAQAKQATDIFDYLDQRGVRRLLQRGYIAPIDCTCKACGGQFTLLRGIVDTKQQPPIYCVWCGTRYLNDGSSALITDPEQTEDTAWTVLSMNYGLPVQAIKIFYNQYASQQAHSSFADYMQTDTVQKLLPLLQLSESTVSEPSA